MIQGLDRAVDNFNALVGKCKSEIKAAVSHLAESVSLTFQPNDVENLYSNLTNARVCEYLDFIK